MPGKYSWPDCVRALITEGGIAEIAHPAYTRMMPLSVSNKLAQSDSMEKDAI